MTKEKVLEDYEETALLGNKHIRAFLTYQGSNKDYERKARVGCIASNGYTRLRATMANELALKMASARNGQAQLTE